MMDRTECLKKYGSDYLIKKQINDGLLFQVGKAVYSTEKDVPYLAVLAFKYPNSVVTMHSAFYLHGLTDVIPDIYDLATDRNAAKIQDKNVKQYFMNGNIFKSGIEKMDYKGYEIPVYSKERMLIELIRNKSKLPFDYYKEIVLNYRKIMPQLDLQGIQDFVFEAPKKDTLFRIIQMEIL